MKKVIVNLQGRLVRNTPRRYTPLFRGGDIPHYADRSGRYRETPMNLFEKIVWGIIAGSAALYALSWLWQTWSHR